MTQIQTRLENWGNYARIARGDGFKHGVTIDLVDARRVDAAVERLPPAYRDMLTGCFVTNLTPNELEHRLNIPLRSASEFVDAFNAAIDALVAIIPE